MLSINSQRSIKSLYNTFNMYSQVLGFYETRNPLAGYFHKKVDISTLNQYFDNKHKKLFLSVSYEISQILKIMYFKKYKFNIKFLINDDVPMIKIKYVNHNKEITYIDILIKNPHILNFKLSIIERNENVLTTDFSFVASDRQTKKYKFERLYPLLFNIQG